MFAELYFPALTLFTSKHKLLTILAWGGVWWAVGGGMFWLCKPDLSHSRFVAFYF
jgi:hypothetical protein